MTRNRHAELQFLSPLTRTVEPDIVPHPSMVAVIHFKRFACTPIQCVYVLRKTGLEYVYARQGQPKQNRVQCYHVTSRG